MNFRQRIAMKLFNDTYDMDPNSANQAPSLDAPWQGVDVISSNCPIHVGVRLAHLGDNSFQCPKGKEIYKAKSNIANQTTKDRYDLGISLK